MADSTYRVEIETVLNNAGLKNAEREIDKITNKSIKQMKAEVIALKKPMIEVDAALVRMQSDLVHLDPTLTKVGSSLIKVRGTAVQAKHGFDSLQTSVTKMAAKMDQSQMLAMNFGRVLADMPYGIQGVANNFEALAMSLTAVTAQAKAANIGLLTMAKSILIGPGGLLLAVNAISAAMVILSRNTGGAEKKIEDLHYQLMRVRGFGLEAARMELKEIEGKLRPVTPLEAQAAMELGPTYPSKGFGVSAGVSGAWFPSDTRRKPIMDDQERMRLEIRAQELRNELAGVPPTVVPQEIWRWPFEREQRGVYELLGYGPAGALMREGQFRGLGGMTPGTAKAGSMKGGIQDAFRGVPQEMMNDVNMMMGAAEAGIQNMANVLRKSMSGAWEDIFGEANSLFEQLLQSVFVGMTSILGQIASQYAVGGLFSLLSFIPGFGGLSAIAGKLMGGGMAGGGVIREPVLGMGLRSGRSYALGERGPERVTPLGRVSGGGSGDNTANILRAFKWKLEGPNLVLAYDANKAMMNRRRFH